MWITLLTRKTLRQLINKARQEGRLEGFRLRHSYDQLEAQNRRSVRNTPSVLLEAEKIVEEKHQWPKHL